MTLCNNSPVDYPNVGVALVLTRCSCATDPTGLPVGTAERFDAATSRAYVEKAKEIGWTAAIKASPQYGEELKKVLAK